MKKFLALTSVVALTSLSALAQDQRHIISIGTDGLGWAGIGETIDFKKSSGVKDRSVSGSELKLNYNYVFPNRFMVGAELMWESATVETKPISGSKSKTETDTTGWGISAGYNFSDDLNDAWWVKVGLMNETSESKQTGMAKTKEGTNQYFVSGGKRFSLKSWGLGNISYAPAITLYKESYSKDLKTAGQDAGTGARLDLIKFDVIF